MKNIIIFSKPFYPSIGGVQNTSRLLAKALITLGYSTTIFTTTHLPKDTKELDEGYRVVRSSNYFKFIWLCLRSDLLFVKGGVSTIAGFIGWITHTPYVFYHEMYGTYLYPKNSLKYKLLNVIRRQLVKSSTAHIGISFSCLESKQLPQDQNIFLIYNPVTPELELYAENLKNEINIQYYDLLFVGRLLEAKGIFLLADVLQAFEEDKFQVTVCFVGPGDTTELATRFSIYKNVKVSFLGPLDAKYLAKTYASSRILVFPSIQPEGMGLVIAEALMFNLPIVASDQSAIIEVLGNAGLFFKGGSKDDLYLCIKKILQDSTLYSDLKTKAMKRKKLFKFESYIREIQIFTKFIEKFIESS